MTVEPTVSLMAARAGPCIVVAPKKLHFGAKKVGSKTVLPVDILSCGSEPLEVRGALLTAASDPAFTVGGVPVTPEAPLMLSPGEHGSVDVVFAPTELNAVVSGTVVIVTNATESAVDVPLAGVGVDEVCPIPVIVVQEGEKVIPQTNLHLYGGQSFAPSGAIVSWKWTAKQPTGGASVFVPSDTFPNPTFEVNTAGQYNFKLDVWDEAGVKSCVPAEVEVIVIP